MIALIQRVKNAKVEVDNASVGEINQGILVLLGVEKEDSKETVEKLFRKIVNYRIFSDDNGKMNQSLLDVQGELLIVSQFTLVADTHKGLRPSFSRGGSPQLGKELYDYAIEFCQKNHSIKVESGQFAADMQVSLLNDGPVTFTLRA